MKNKITLKESEFRDLLTEAVKRVLSEVGETSIIFNEEKMNEAVSNVITEMSSKLKKFKGDVKELCVQIIENWCLCAYCRMFDFDNKNFNHWAGELNGYIKTVCAFKTKCNADKAKHIARVFITDGHYDNVDTLYETIYKKFQEEHFTDEDMITSVCEAFIENLNELIDVLANKSSHTNDYAYWKFDYSEN